MMGLEPTTFCMATRRSGSRAFAPVRSNTSIAGRLPRIERTRPNPSERRTVPFLPRKHLATREGDAQASCAARKSAKLGRCPAATGARPGFDGSSVEQLDHDRVDLAADAVAFKSLADAAKVRSCELPRIASAPL
jgi:hypothetical protein